MSSGTFAGQGQGKPILVIDDEPSALSYLSHTLKKAGHTVLSADSGYTAFVMLEKRLADQGEVHLKGIICDWKMPGWDGLKLLAELRQSPYKEVPFILMSGAVTRDELVQAGKAQANGVLLKPLDKELLIQRVRELFGEPESSADDSE